MAKPYALLLALLLGLAAPLAFAPYSLWPILPLSLTGLFWLCLQQKQGASLGFAYGLGWFGYGIHWVHVSMAQFGGMPLIASLFLMLLLVAYLSIYPALACALINKVKRQQSPFALLLLLPSSWLLAEWLRSWMLTGFPWLQAAYSQLESPLAGYAPVIGSLGLTWLTAFCASAVLLILQRRQAPLMLSLLLGLVAGGLGLAKHPWTELQEPMQVALVQGNIPLDQKWLPEYRHPTLKLYQQASLASNADVIIWPESAIPALEYEEIDYLHRLDQALIAKQQALITGVITHDLQSHDFYNGLISLGLGAADSDKSYYFEHPNRYYKQHLLPIGEFVPFEDLLRPLAPFFNLPMSSFSRGSDLQANLQVKGHAWLASICYEIAFGELLRQQFSPNTDAIITISNDAWFGDSIGPWQHLEMAQMRALEFGRPVLRSTNTGHTAVINHFGEIEKIAPSFEQLTLEASFKPATGSTPYQRWGEWPFIIISFLILLLNAILQARQKKSPLIKPS